MKEMKTLTMGGNTYEIVDAAARSTVQAGIEGIKELLPTRAVLVTLPMGRMRGDVDGDGKITEADREAVLNHINHAPDLTDDIALWCADVTNDGSIRAGDGTQILRFVDGDTTTISVLTSTPTMADYYENWTYSKIDDLTGEFYTDISVSDMTADSIADISVPSGYEENGFRVECLDGAARVYAKWCPITAIEAELLIYTKIISNPCPYIVATTAPENTSLFWIDSSVEGDHILKYYNATEGAWLPIRIAWG